MMMTMMMFGREKGLKFKCFGEKVTGNSHLIHNKKCQDSYNYEDKNEDFLIIAVADGHGSDKCEKSDIGSQIAVNVFCSYFKELINQQKTSGSLESIYHLLKSYMNDRYPKDIVRLWREEVKNNFNTGLEDLEENLSLKNNESDDLDVYLKYGTTLLGLIITDEFYFVMQLGDGDILAINKYDEVTTIPPPVEEKMLGTETYSLCEEKPWLKFLSGIYRMPKESAPVLFMLSTDGFANSFTNDDEFKKSGRDYLNLLQKHGEKVIKDNLETWLNETSVNGCGDDITLVLAYNENIVLQGAKSDSKFNRLKQYFKFRQYHQKT